MKPPFRLARWLLAGLVGLAPLAAPAMAKAPNEYHLFVWKVTRPGAAPEAVPDYLIGTMHLPVDAGRLMPAPVHGLIAEATAVVTEADTRDLRPETLQPYMALKGDQSLRQLLGAASWAKLLKAAKPLGLPPERLARLEPWFVNVALTLPAPDGRPVIDDLVQAAAREAGVPVSHLEQAVEQIRIMDSVAQDEDLRQLIDTLDHPGQAKALLERLRRGYFAGDLAEVERLVFDPRQVRSYPDFYRKLLFDRNARWAPKLDALFQGEDAVVAVGLGHMLGERGLIALLKRRGYAVEPLAL